MIRPISINKTSFQGFYSKQGEKYTPTQYFVAKDIKTKLANKAKTDDFLVSTGAIKDSVELWKVKGLVAGDINEDELELSWKEAEFIGAYSKEAPFKLNDLDKKQSNAKDFVTGIFAGIGLTLAACALALLAEKLFKPKTEEIKNINIEKLQQNYNDTISKFNKDSIKLWY